MPPHCDTLDGPVVKAAKKALKNRDVKIILPYVHKEGEKEIIKLFKKVVGLHKRGKAIKDLADRYFFETVVRVHRAGEGAPYTGLKPAGLPVGPIIPLAEEAIKTGSPKKLIKELTGAVSGEVQKRFSHLQHLKQKAGKDVASSRAYVETMLGLQVWSHKLYLTTKAEAHGDEHHH